MLEEKKNNDIDTNYTSSSLSNIEEENNAKPQRQISLSTANKLRQQALKFKEYYDEYQLNYSSDTSDVLYLISQKFLTQWKLYVSYDEIINDRQPSKFFGVEQPDPFNEDLLAKDIESCFKYSPLKENPWNIYLKDGIQEKHDYEIFNKKISDLFHIDYEGKSIHRNVIGEGAERYVEVNLLRFQTILLYPGLVSNVSNNYSSKGLNSQEFLQVARSFPVAEFYALLDKTISTFRGNFQREKGVRIWKCPPSEDPLKSLLAIIKRQTIDLDYHEDVVFDFDGELIDETKYATIEEIGISPSDLIVIEFKESSKPWTIKNSQVSAEGKCEGCYNVRVLSFTCVCKKVSYCTEKCKIGDEKFHSSKCEKQASDDEIVQEIQSTENSVQGVCGLSNLGNTCFMNSGLQCLANTMILSEFFLTNKYFSQINEDNPLGSKGILVRKYGSLIKKLFYGSKNIVQPSALKIAIGKFQPMFKGYHQHDSSELITFLLDGLHEDLNLIKVKPYVESKDSEDRQDFEIAKEAWEGFTQRNRSIIVDTMYGQYKSKLQCPTCSRISITFDPFLMVSLTVPSNKKKTLNYNIQKDLVRSLKQQEIFEKNSTQTVKEFLNKLSNEQFRCKQVIMFLMSSYSSYEYVSPDMTLADARKKSKRAGLGVRVLTDVESSIDDDKRLYIPIQNKSVESYNYKKSFYQNNLIILSRDYTLEQAHMAIFELYGFLFKHLIGEQSVTRELFENTFQDKYFSVELKSNGSFWQQCSYCGKKNCSDCKLPYTTETLGEYADAAEKLDNQLRFELVIVWNKTPFENTKLVDVFDHFIKTQLMTDETDDKNDNEFKMIKENGNTSVSLTECLQYSQQPEQLEADNTWYCRNCKDHVRAFKSMQIYKAPKILMFHLKRFKASNRMFKQKLETLVDFPLNGLDLSEFIINSNIPGTYTQEDLSNNGENKQHKKVVYDLYAVSNHFGGLGGGHYTAFAKNYKDNQWYNFDDSHASQIEPSDQVVSKAAYVLFYKQREAEDEKNFNNIDN